MRMKDEIITEVWKVKDAISAEHHHDVRSLLKHLMAEEKSGNFRVVDLHARQCSSHQTSVG